MKGRRERSSSLTCKDVMKGSEGKSERRQAEISKGDQPKERTDKEATVIVVMYR